MKFLKKITYFHWVTLIYSAILLFVFPWEHVGSTFPSTGGDIGSHFYPIHAILKSFSIRPWNPGNLGGEPLLVHYFPFPFMLMSFFGLFLPAGFVFNWLHILPVYALPFCAYYFLNKTRSPGLSSSIGFIACVLFIFNTSYYAWGGNIFSLMSGQFNHSYALCFLFLWMGTTYEHLEQNNFFSLKSSILVASIILSHAYIALSLPVAGAVILLISKSENFFDSLKKITFNATVGLGLTIWWIIPFFTNAPWTTPYGDSWLPRLTVESYLPKPFIAVLSLGLISLVVVFARHRLKKEFFSHGILLFIGLLTLSVFYFGLVKIFPLVGLVDIRAIPQIQLFTGIALSILIGIVLNSFKPRIKLVLFFSLLLFSIFSIQKDIQKVKTRMVWNWSGWKEKVGHKDFMKVNDHLRGDFSMPRVAFEHGRINQAAGTIRAFEMLPYFSGRATTEGLYMQATAYSPLAFFFQSLIGREKSCPFPNFPCGNLNLKKAAELMPILGIQELILWSNESLKAAKELPEKFQFVMAAGPWKVFKLKEEVSLVEVVSNISPLKEEVDWKIAGVQYVLERGGNTPWFFVPGSTDEAVKNEIRRSHLSNSSHCKPLVEVDFNKIFLRTNCPGYPHVIKFSFHPSFRADSGDPLFLMLPNYIGIIPSKNQVTLNFAETWDWKFSILISLAVLIFIIYHLVSAQHVREKAKNIFNFKRH